ncbi:hypothetical protein A5824_002286 [Enterococcus faecalis]|uniref:WxL domain-containing protein n=1 Tax=Enterococcus faecalis TaxID=1351 RepID=UPI000A33FAF0|nr:WxL domain-containing protein [Enterococcus faecalis]OTP32986.1 hypothetical protein A5824_002286 [Enterococcus faecalis]
MKRNKWQRLAAIGLCGSLLVNAFSGVTAVAETVTIESSPTAESSVKEETQASSETQTTSETTIETSQEEVTQETEKQAEVAVEKKEAPPVKAEQEEAKTAASEIVQPNLLSVPKSIVGVSGGNLEEAYQQLLEIQKNFQRVSPQAQIITPDIAVGVNLTSSDGTAVNIDDFELNATMGQYTDYWLPSAGKYISNDYAPIDITSTKYAKGIQINIPSRDVWARSNATYTRAIYYYYLRDVSLSVPKYISAVQVGEELVERRVRSYNVSDWESTLNIKKINQETYQLITTPGAFGFDNAYAIFCALADHGAAMYDNSRFSVNLAGKNIELAIDYKKVTENFVDATGAKITAPTGFTQGQQTSITSNDFTYTSAKALPDTYKAGSKTYKFKGWYKGKTKPATLKTTKTPSYAVTYDDNDDLNVVYEEAVEFPEETYQFGFVNQDGQLVKPDDITITYDYSEFLTNNGTNTWNGIALNQKATTVEKLKKITMPKSSLPKNTVNGEAMINISFSLPKYYTGLSIYDKSGKIDSNYPLPPRHYYMDNQEVTGMPSDATFITWLTLAKAADNSYVFKDALTSPLPINSSFPMMRRGVTGYPYYHSLDAPVYYHLTQRKVTENFVDASGAKITPPTGFTQGKQTAITSDPYTFKQAGTLPDTYKAGTKTYKFKGWYKGKTKPATLKTTKTPSYAVTYDDNDDMTAVYEEVKDTAVHPGFYAEFVDEQGKAFTNPLTLSGNYTEYLRKIDNSPFEATGSLYPMVGSKDATVANRYKVETKQSVSIPNNFFEDYPADILHKGFALNNFNITNELKYVDKVEATTKTITLYDYDTISDIGTNLLSDSVTASLNSFETVFNREVNNTFSVKAKWGQPGIARETIPNLLALGSISSKPRLLGFDGTSDYKQTINYKVTRKQVTENFVDAAGVKITAPTGFTQGKQTPMTSNTFKYTAAKALPASYSAGGKTYTFQGWYKGKTKPTTLSKVTTPTFSATFDGNDDMTAVYKEEVPKASVTLTRTTAETVTSGGNVTWRATITNTSQAPLTTATIKKSTAWTAGLAAPTAMIVTPVGGTAKTVPVTATTWTNGVSLGVNIPVGKSATVQFTTKATGTAGKVLRAGITTSGNYSGVSASATVRVKDNDQAIVTPTAEGFISTPTFDFGQVAISGTKQQYGLKKAAAYYGNGTRNPYLRIKKTQPNWSLTAQLSQPKSATDSLPTATRLLLGAAPVSSFSNYNQPTELKNTIGTTKVINLTANNTATNIVANQQFTGSDVYQLDFVFDNIKLEVPASQGMTRQQYQATVTWNLVTGP